MATIDPEVVARADELMKSFEDGPTPEDLDSLAVSILRHDLRSSQRTRDLAAELTRRAEKMRALAAKIR